jgi:hypothetical protein
MKQPGGFEMKPRRLVLCRDASNAARVRLTLQDRDDLVIGQVCVDLPLLRNAVTNLCKADEGVHVLDHRTSSIPARRDDAPKVVARADWTVTPQGAAWAVVDGEGWVMRDATEWENGFR